SHGCGERGRYDGGGGGRVVGVGEAMSARRSSGGDKLRRARVAGGNLGDGGEVAGDGRRRRAHGAAVSAGDGGGLGAAGGEVGAGDGGWGEESRRVGRGPTGGDGRWPEEKRDAGCGGRLAAWPWWWAGGGGGLGMLGGFSIRDRLEDGFRSGRDAGPGVLDNQ
ncbi:hypothetical protein BRADI_4g31508v3, partial [Brachypodium distachyon]